MRIDRRLAMLAMAAVALPARAAQVRTRDLLRIVLRADQRWLTKRDSLRLHATLEALSPCAIWWTGDPLADGFQVHAIGPEGGHHVLDHAVTPPPASPPPPGARRLAPGFNHTIHLALKAGSAFPGPGRYFVSVSYSPRASTRPDPGSRAMLRLTGSRLLGAGDGDVISQPLEVRIL